MPERLPARPPARPRHLSSAWPAIVRAARSATRLALFIDFDGTLTKIQRSPHTVRLSSGVRRVLTALASNGHLVGIVSGRALDDIEARVGVPHAWYVGDQGFLLRAPGSARVILASPGQRTDIARVARKLRTRLKHASGVSVETKTATLTVHYRGAPQESRAAAGRAVRAVLNGSSGLRVIPGKQIWEVLPDAPINKARAVAFIQQLAGGSATGRGRAARWLSIYIGDDVADEQVFRTWRGLSVAVGRRRRTAARYYLRSPSEVRAALEELARIYAV